MKHKLRAILEKHGHTQKDLAELLGVSYQSISIKLNKNQFTQKEIHKIIKRYEMTSEEVIEAFFDDNGYKE